MDVDILSELKIEFHEEPETRSLRVSFSVQQLDMPCSETPLDTVYRVLFPMRCTEALCSWAVDLQRRIWLLDFLKRTET